MVSMSSSYTIFPLYLFTVVIVSSDAFLQGQSLPETVDRWLHWGANIHDTQKVPPAPHPRAALPWGDKSSSEVPSYIIGAAMSNHTSHFPPDYSQQMMHRAEVDLIASYLRPTDVYLEYGSGGSTINFVPLVARAYSVEHNCEWTNFMSSSLKAHPRANLYSNLHFHCISMVPGFRGWGTLSSYEHANYVQFREYVNAIDSFSETTFDRVFIDGRASKSHSDLYPRYHLIFPCTMTFELTLLALIIDLFAFITSLSLFDAHSNPRISLRPQGLALPQT